MKKIKIILFFCSILILLTSSSCETNDELEFGENTFSCYINGELFTPKPSTSISTSPLSEELIFNRSSNFYARATDHKKFKIFFNIENFHEGEFKLKTSNGNSYNYQLDHAVIIAYADSNNDNIYISKENSGKITFTNVTDSNVEGIFEFTLYNVNDDNDTIRITNGKFND